MPEADGGLDERHEVKFAAYATEHAVLERWIHMHPAGFVCSYPNREVNNIYFDTFDYRAYAENVAGVSERSKVRYRWYGESREPDLGSLEIKQKRNYFGWKLRYPVNEKPYHNGYNWHDIRVAIRAQLPMDAQLWLHQNPLPIMLNRYERQYFATTDGSIRVTIDTNQRVFDQRIGNRPNFTHQAITQDTLVVEFKFSRPDRQDAVGILQDMPLRIGRHSKYMNAVRAISFA
ncbi:MAG: polyphosphate polymerase domain-containing protein [Gammaproteobacteria bacterium]|nr:polyphosphate polymerase domain-containing protein [Gammaproteobacteria bacterium]MCP4090708.1 polyphosphate polymerase domain-containing protein [Gammaproteobacteria bacterium]MCP4277135.1 polyphosphate polymerase domain-containing protein [Gammaproteobacteria bacterium]MCP4832691.1 polyphosphate polymerase domain-containing protein [Gammaproteobacteria bacterium]MCP4928055.1 polyphosphate polymerase domain-containing protein [Gammaproteobacteria bacterium]